MNDQSGLSIVQNRYFNTLNRIYYKVISMHTIAKKKVNASKKLLQNNVKLIILVWTKIRAK